MSKALRLQLAKKIYGISAGNTPSRYEAEGYEIIEKRDFQLSDNPRAIDLLALNLRDDLEVWDKRPDHGANVYISFDVSASGEFGPKGLSKKSFMSEFGSTLALACVSDFCRIGMVFHSDIIEHLEYLTANSIVIDTACQLLTQKPKSKKTDLNLSLGFLLGQMSAIKEERPDLVFIISDFLADDFEEKLRVLAYEVDCVALVIRDPLDIDFPSLGGVMMCQDPETGNTFLVSGNNEFYQNLEETFKKNNVTAAFLDTTLSVERNLEIVANTLENSERSDV